jgi:hypothetical protein
MTTISRLVPTAAQSDAGCAAIYVVMLDTARCVVIAEGEDCLLATACGADAGGFSMGTVDRAVDRLAQQREQRRARHTPTLDLLQDRHPDEPIVRQ